MTDRRRRPHRSLAIVSAVLLVASGAIANVGVVAEPLPLESAPPGRTTWESPRPDWGVETPVISADGNWVAFQSASPHVVPEDTNGVRDIFLLELATGSVTRVSVASDGTQANGPSGNATNVNGIRGIDYDPPAISGDGRFVAFQSSASNLVAGDENGVEDVFVYDRGVSPGAPSTVLVSSTAVGVSADGPSHSASISRCAADVSGRFDEPCVVAFVSEATNLPGDPSDGGRHLFRRKGLGGSGSAFGVAERMDCSDAAHPIVIEGDVSSPSVEQRSGVVAFSATVVGDAEPSILISLGDCRLLPQSLWAPNADGASLEPVFVSAGARSGVVFTTTATNIVPGRTMSGRNVVFYDSVEVLQLSEGERSGRARSPAAFAHVDPTYNSLERFFVAYVVDSDRSAPIDGIPTVVVQSLDSWGATDVRLAERTFAGSAPSLGAEGSARENASLVLGASPAGSAVGVQPGPSVLVSGTVYGDPDNIEHYLVRPLAYQFPALDPSLSDDGRWVAFASAAPDLVPGDRNVSSDVFVRNIDTGALVRVSVATDGTERVGGAAQPAVSADGRYVAFAAAADYAHSGGEIVNPVSALKADGSFMVPAASGLNSDIYVRDRDSDEDGVFDEPDRGATRTVLISQGYDVLGGVVSSARTQGVSRRPDITPDGRHVVFESTADNLAEDGSRFDTGGHLGVVAHDRDADRNSIFDEMRVPVDPAASGGLTKPGTRTSLLTVGWEFDFDSQSLVPATAPPATGASGEPVFSASGRYVAYTTSAENLLRAGRFVCASASSTPAATPPSACPAGQIAVDYVFETNQDQPDVVIADRDPDGDGNFDGGAYIPNVLLADSIRTELVSKSAAGGNLDAPSTSPSITDDGRLVTFVTAAAGAVTGPEVPYHSTQVYLRDVQAETNELISVVGTAVAAVAGDGDSDDPSISANGRMVAFRSRATNLVRGDPDGFDVLVRDLRTTPRSTVIASVGTGEEPGENAFPSGSGPRGVGETGTTIDGVGRRVGFSTDSTNFDPRDGNGIEDVYVRTWLPDLVVRPNPVDFGIVDTATTSPQQTVSVENRGFGPIRITGQELTGADVARFATVAPGLSCTGANGVGLILDRTESCAVSSHTFTPIEAGPQSALVTVLTEDMTIRPTAMLVGVGRKPPSKSTVPPDSSPEMSPETTTTTAPPAVVLRHTPFIDITPNVTLAGRVVEVRGGGFPSRSQVELRWSAGIPNSTSVQTDSLGSFTTRVLLLPNDFVGPRLLEAIWVGGPAATDELLVVRGTVDRDFISRR